LLRPERQRHGHRRGRRQRLVSRTCSGSSPYETSSPYQTGYSYDSLGELVTQTAPVTTAAPSGQVTSYSYDPAGNELTEENPDG